MFKELEPIPHFKLTDYVRVPVYKEDDVYIVYVAKNFRRRYSLKTLPSFIKSKNTVANCIATSYKEDHEINAMDVFNCHEEIGDPDTAWRASESMYVVIIHVNDFYELTGSFYDDDPRKEN